MISKEYIYIYSEDNMNDYIQCVLWGKSINLITTGNGELDKYGDIKLWDIDINNLKPINNNLKINEKRDKKTIFDHLLIILYYLF